MPFVKALFGIAIALPALFGQFGQTPIGTLPQTLEVDSGERSILVTGNGFQPGWQVLWNGSPRETVFLSQYRLQVNLQAEDTASPSLSSVSVVDQGNQLVRTPLPFWVYVPLANNDFVYDTRLNRMWVAVPRLNARFANGIAVLNPETGSVERFIPTPAEPVRIHLTEDGRFLYISLAGRILRLNTTSYDFDLDFALPSNGSNPFVPSAMTTRPGDPDVLVVSLRAPFRSPGNVGSIVFDRGLRRGSGNFALEDGPVEFPGWTATGQLIGTSDSKLYLISLVADGLKADRITDLTFLVPIECKYSNSLLYCGSGRVIDPMSGRIVSGYPAKGNIALLPDADRIAFIDTGLQGPTGAILGPLTIMAVSSAETVFSALVPMNGGSTFGPLISWGTNGFAWRDAGFNGINTPTDRLFIFRSR